MAAAGQTEQAKISGQISIEAIEVPDHMTVEAIEEAGCRRLEDVFVVLEHNRIELEKRLSTKADAIDPNAHIITSQLMFEANKPSFDVVLGAQAKRGKQFNGDEWRKQLPSLVSGTLSDFISEKATSVGYWKVAVTVDFERNTDNNRVTKAGCSKNYTRVNFQHGMALASVLLLAAGVLAFLVFR